MQQTTTTSCSSGTELDLVCGAVALDKDEARLTEFRRTDDDVICGGGFDDVIELLTSRSVDMSTSASVGLLLARLEHCVSGVVRSISPANDEARCANQCRDEAA